MLKRLIMLVLLVLFVPSTLAATSLPVDFSGGPAPLVEGWLSENEYKDDAIHVTIERGRYMETNYVLARITIAHPSQLRTALAGKRFADGKSTLAMTIANRENAVFAINGDDFGLRRGSFTWRQGVKYRENPENGRDVMILDDKGDMHFLLNTQRKEPQAFEGVIVNAFSFGPALVVDGVQQSGFQDLGFGVNKSAQRMCFAQTGPLSYLCLTSEGPEDKASTGLKLSEFADLVASFPEVKQAYNLDGGTTATMVLGGKKVNAPGNPKTRWVNDIIYFATLGQEEKKN